MRPYFEHAGISLFHADARGGDLVVDPMLIRLTPNGSSASV